MIFFKKLTSICLSIVMIFTMTGVTSFAATEESNLTGLPEDAVILSQDGNVTLYKSESQAKADGIVTTSDDMDYAYAWVDPSDSQNGTFYISKTISGKAHITFKVESNYAGAYAFMTLRYKNGNYITASATNIQQGDNVLDTTISTKTDYQIDYMCYNNSQGMRLMCWFWN